MRNMKLGLVLALFGISLLMACGDIDERTLPEETESMENDVENEKENEKENEMNLAAMNAYAGILKDIFRLHKYPDGSSCCFICDYDMDGNFNFQENCDLSDNKYAICDVDMDGHDELIIKIVGTFTANAQQHVYKYDESNNTVFLEYIGYPLLNFYDNGIVTEGISHNQGLAGNSLWPYRLSKYNSSTKSYDYIASVDSWDKSFRENDYEGNPFPDEIDTSQTGVIYYVQKAGEGYDTEPIDYAEYNTWYQSLLGDAHEIPIPYLPFTIYNINSFLQDYCTEEVNSISLSDK